MLSIFDKSDLKSNQRPSSHYEFKNFLTNTEIREPHPTDPAYAWEGPLPTEISNPLDTPRTEEYGPGLGISKRGILNISNIDPEQFRLAKGLAKSMLETANNSSNYGYTNAEIEEAGGIANLVMRNMLKQS